MEVSTVEEQLKFIKSELARTEETTRVLEGMLARLAEVYAPWWLWWLVSRVVARVCLCQHENQEKAEKLQAELPRQAVVPYHIIIIPYHIRPRDGIAYDMRRSYIHFWDNFVRKDHFCPLPNL